MSLGLAAKVGAMHATWQVVAQLGGGVVRIGLGGWVARHDLAALVGELTALCAIRGGPCIISLSGLRCSPLQWLDYVLLLPLLARLGPRQVIWCGAQIDPKRRKAVLEMAFRLGLPWEAVDDLEEAEVLAAVNFVSS